MIREGDPDGDSTIRGVIEHQVAWAAGQGLALAPGGQAFSDQDSALFVDQLCAETVDELTTGAGGELNRIRSLRSSSCLVLNVFEPWRNNPRAVGDVFGAEVESLSFEAQQPTGLKGVAPHLDVLLTGPNGSVAIESKFLEMYSPTDNHFAESYFAKDDLWAGLGNARDLAVRIADGSEQFRWLHAAQLLKHALGLSKNQQTDFRLVLLWYRVEGPIAEDLEAEISRFARAVSDDFNFTSMTYQELATRLRNLAEPMPGYFSYLEGRYLLDGTWARQLPLIDIAAQQTVNHRRVLDSTIQDLDADSLATSYARTVATAPQRPLHRKQFLVDHDGGGDASSTTSEKVVAKALYNGKSPLSIDGRAVRLIDYEVPLRAHQADGGVGEIDLLGIDEASHRPWIIELKVAPNSETPLKALLQALRYTAIVDANRRALTRELKGRFGYAEVSWPAGLAIAADHQYWDRLINTRPAGDWLPALQDLCRSLERALGFDIALLDISTVEVEHVDGRARLKSELAVLPVAREGSPPRWEFGRIHRPLRMGRRPVTIREADIAAVTEVARNIPPASGNYIEEDFVMNLLATVIDYQQNTTTVVRALQHFKNHRWGEIRSGEDLDQVMAGFPDDKEGNTALAQYLWGYNLWTRAKQLRDLVGYFRNIGVTDQESLRRWAKSSKFERDFQGRVKGLGVAVYHWLVMRQGVDTVKPDVHVRRFAEKAVGRPLSDRDVVDVVVKAAHEMGMKAYELDWAIWEFSRSAAE